MNVCISYVYYTSRSNKWLRLFDYWLINFVRKRGREREREAEKEAKRKKWHVVFQCSTKRPTYSREILSDSNKTSLSFLSFLTELSFRKGPVHRAPNFVCPAGISVTLTREILEMRRTARARSRALSVIFLVSTLRALLGPSSLLPPELSEVLSLRLPFSFLRKENGTAGKINFAARNPRVFRQSRRERGQIDASYIILGGSMFFCDWSRFSNLLRARGMKLNSSIVATQVGRGEVSTTNTWMQANCLIQTKLSW